MLNALKQQPEDKIIRLIQEYKSDLRKDKIDLGVGVYRDRTGATPIMRAVKRAEKMLWEAESTKAYTGLAGDPEYRQAMTALILGEQAPTECIASIHTPGGTGAVRQAYELIRLAGTGAKLWISDPSWPNHISMARHLGIADCRYRYFDGESRGVDFSGMMQDLQSANAGDVVVLHGCCHNPTGANLDREQWRELTDLLKGKQLMPLVDIAYQGFGDGLIDDRSGVEVLTGTLPEVLIAASCSKNFGIYRERTGILIAKAESPSEAAKTQSTLTHLNRQNFSFPPDHGARLVTIILNDPDLRSEWENELNSVREGMLVLRRQLADELHERSNSNRFGFLASHRGMFSLLGATQEQVLKMRKDNGIYMVSDSRINVAGLNRQSVPVLAEAMLNAGL